MGHRNKNSNNNSNDNNNNKDDDDDAADNINDDNNDSYWCNRRSRAILLVDGREETYEEAICINDVHCPLSICPINKTNYFRQ